MFAKRTTTTFLLCFDEVLRVLFLTSCDSTKKPFDLRTVFSLVVLPHHDLDLADATDERTIVGPLRRVLRVRRVRHELAGNGEFFWTNLFHRQTETVNEVLMVKAGVRVQVVEDSVAV